MRGYVVPPSDARAQRGAESREAVRPARAEPGHDRTCEIGSGWGGRGNTEGDPATPGLALGLASRLCRFRNGQERGVPLGHAFRTHLFNSNLER